MSAQDGSEPQLTSLTDLLSMLQTETPTEQALVEDIRPNSKTEVETDRKAQILKTKARIQDALAERESNTMYLVDMINREAADAARVTIRDEQLSPTEDNGKTFYELSPEIRIAIAERAQVYLLEKFAFRLRKANNLRAQLDSGDGTLDEARVANIPGFEKLSTEDRREYASTELTQEQLLLKLVAVGTLTKGDVVSLPMLASLGLLQDQDVLAQIRNQCVTSEPFKKATLGFCKWAQTPDHKMYLPLPHITHQLEVDLATGTARAVRTFEDYNKAERAHPKTSEEAIAMVMKTPTIYSEL